MQSDRTTISRALSQNRELKEQLAELQNGFVRLVRSLQALPTRGTHSPLLVMGWGWVLSTSREACGNDPGAFPALWEEVLVQVWAP